MRAPLNWLNDYFESPLTNPEAIKTALTLAGLEVEGIERVAPGLELVITGKILAADQHPNADRLRICRTDVGAGEPLQIVTGAANVQAGDIVPVAMIGAKLPTGLELKPSKLRGVESFGMYCSLKELGLPEGVDGVHVLPPDTPLGIPVAQAMGLGEIVFEVSVLANRPDALSMMGIARELAAAGLGKLKQPQIAELPSSGDAGILVTLEAPDLCPRYAALKFESVQVGPAPDWMRARLELAGLRSISNVVDVTNYVMLELGQPLHAFDGHKLEAKTLSARRAKQGERLKTLDDQERELSPEMLVIADASGPQAIAGVMGGQATEVNDQTQTLILEAAYFEPSSIRKTAKVLGLRSESSYRFERGVDPEGTVKALARATQLLVEVTGARVTAPVVEAKPSPDYPPPSPMVLTLRPERVTRILGCEMPMDQAKSKLEAIGFSVASGVFWQVRVPGWRRHDVTREIDLIEEIARLIGYDAVPPHLMPLAELGSAERPESKVRTLFEGKGHLEVVTNSLMSEAALRMAHAPLGEAIHLANPLADMVYLRTSMLPGLLEVARFNHYQGHSSFSCYEIGKTYHRVGGATEERRWVAFLQLGETAKGMWKHAPDALVADFAWAKGTVEQVLAGLGQGSPEATPLADHPAMHPGRTARLSLAGREIGVVGELHPERYQAYDLPAGGRATVGWLSLDVLEALISKQPRSFRRFGRFPAVRRDLALVVPETVSAVSVVASVREMGGASLEEVEVFDAYKGPQIPPGRVSLGLRLSYRSKDRTLSDEEIEPLHRRIVERAEEAFGAALRDR